MTPETARQVRVTALDYSIRYLNPEYATSTEALLSLASEVEKFILGTGAYSGPVLDSDTDKILVATKNES